MLSVVLAIPWRNSRFELLAHTSEQDISREWVYECSRSTMNSKPASNSNRRHFLKQSGTMTAGAALMANLPANVHAADDQTIRLALIGCGNRGTGAVRDALSVVASNPVKLHAMADIHQSAIDGKRKVLAKLFDKRVDVPDERQFVGFDSYKRAIDCLRSGDVAMCMTRAYIRPTHVAYAVKKGINVFMEKPFASDPGSLHQLLKTAEEAEKKGVKIAAGLQCRHSPARQELIERIRDGEMGDINLIRANRLGSGWWLKPTGDKGRQFTEQLKFGKVHLMWVGSGHMVDNLIHQIDECCWIKDAWPVSCAGMGGRQPNSTDCGQNLATYSMEYTFADGTKALCGFRRQRNTRNEFATFIHGTKRAAQFSGNVHAATVHMFKDQRIARSNISWTPQADEETPWQYEWNNFIQSIITDRPHNEAKRAVYSDLTSLMGRAAAHTGEEVTWDDMMKSRFQFCENYSALDYDSEPPALPNDEGQFPVPIPGMWKEV